MKRRRVERAVLIWPKEDKNTDDRKSNSLINLFPNLAAGLVFLSTLCAISYNSIITIYNKGYSSYFGISDSLINDSLVFVIFLISLIVVLFLFFIISLSVNFTLKINVKLTIVCVVSCCVISAFILFLFMKSEEGWNDFSLYVYIIIIEMFLIIYFLVIFYEPTSIKFCLNKIFIALFVEILVIICFAYLFVFNYSFAIVNLISSIGSNFAKVESNYKIVSYEYENASYLLLENTDHQYILMEVEEIACEDEKICYKGTRGKYQYIEDLTNLQIQETHCKIIF